MGTNKEAPHLAFSNVQRMRKRYTLGEGRWIAWKKERKKELNLL